MGSYLRKTIMTTLAAATLTAVSSPVSAANICSDTMCWEVPNPVDPPAPIYTPPTIDDPYPSDPGGDNSGDGGGGSEPVPAPDFAACLNLLNTQPHGCTRDLAAAGLQKPASLIPSSLQDMGDQEMLPNLTRQFHGLLNGALDNLNKCYANTLEAPKKCENNFLAALGNGSDIQRLGSQIDSWSFGLGLSEIGTSLVAAWLARDVASWVGALSPSVGIGTISINFGVVGESLASLNEFNDALYKARLQKSCTLWVGAWDQAHCQ
ncbi:MAG: hypothetical protein NW204_09440 [Xanthomonadaceae bacterium]|nr:hypothetical protein [Xanthomonadaceae bacterium]